MINQISEKKIPDLLIISTELNMVSGMSTVKTIREAGNNIPVIFTANSITRENIMQCKELGAVDCILKPFNIHYLIERVQLAMAAIEK